MSDDRFVKGERVYLPLGEGITAPTGCVWEDDGGVYVVVVHMPPVVGVGIVRNHMDELAGRFRVPRARLRRDMRGRNSPAYTETPVAGEAAPTIVASRVEHLGALVKDAIRPEEIRRRMQMTDFEATRDIFAASGALLAFVELMVEKGATDLSVWDAVEDAAGSLRAAFDKWIPGWDQPESGLNLN